MATTDKTPAAKTTKPAKTPVPVAQRLTDQLKRGALQGKLTAAELDSLAALAGALKTFVSTP
jgi:HAMP domain-containing protein